MANQVVVFKILFLVLIAHSFIAQQCSPAAQTVPFGSARPKSEEETPGSEKILQDPGGSASRERRQVDPLQAGATESAILVEEPAASSTAAVPSDNSSTERPPEKSGSPTEPEARSGQPERVSTPAPPVNYAELCYLSNGGSSITLTVNEATQVGSIIGTVEVSLLHFVWPPSCFSGSIFTRYLAIFAGNLAEPVKQVCVFSPA